MLPRAAPFKKHRGRTPRLQATLRGLHASPAATAIANTLPAAIPYSVDLICRVAPPSRPVQLVTLTTQVSLDRWPKFEQVAAAWGGPVSVAVYVPAPPGGAAAARGATLLRRWAEGYASRHPRQPLAVSALYATHHAPEGAQALAGGGGGSGGDGAGLPPGAAAAADIRVGGGASEERTYERLYPINALRNVAVSAATTAAVLFQDADFHPSRGLAAALSQPGGELHSEVQALLAAAQQGRLSMLVLPTFELALPAPAADVAPLATPATKAELLACPAARPFSCGVFAQPPTAASLDYGAWSAATAPFTAQYRALWEPLGVVPRALAPPFDERFRGYGLNKQQWALHLAALACTFTVAPTHFLVTAPHARARTWRSGAPGSSSDAAQLDRVRRLYAAFAAELLRGEHGAAVGVAAGDGGGMTLPSAAASPPPLEQWLPEWAQPPLPGASYGATSA